MLRPIASGSSSTRKKSDWSLRNTRMLGGQPSRGQGIEQFGPGPEQTSPPGYVGRLPGLWRHAHRESQRCHRPSAWIWVPDEYDVSSEHGRSPRKWHPLPDRSYLGLCGLWAIDMAAFTTFLRTGMGNRFRPPNRSPRNQCPPSHNGGASRWLDSGGELSAST